MYRYARNKSGEIIKDFAGNPFIFDMKEDADGFLRQILGLSFDEYTIHYALKRGSELPSEQMIEEGVQSA